MHFSFRGQRPVERSEVALDLKHQSPKKNCKELTGQHTSRLLPIQKCACKSHHSRLPRAAFAKGTYARAAKSHYSRTSERFARKSNYSRTYAKTGGWGCHLQNALSCNSFVFFHYVNYSVKYNCRRADILVPARDTQIARPAEHQEDGEIPRLRDPTRQTAARKKESGRSARDDGEETGPSAWRLVVKY